MQKKYNILKTFLLNFINHDFFSELINIELYPSNFNQINSQNNVIDLFYKFLKDISVMSTKLNISNLNLIKGYISLSTTILNIRESGSAIINYDNVFRHLSTLDISQQQIIKSAIENKIEFDTEFKTKTNDLIANIEKFYELITISDGLSQFDNFLDHISKTNVSVFEATKIYKERIMQMYNDLSKLQSINNISNDDNYFVIDKEGSTYTLAKSLVDYITTKYSIFKSGFDIIDENLDGIETGSLHIISAPTNHGKSIFLSNVLRLLVEQNIDTFRDDDAILFLTLEDDIRKLTRRLCSIFGNYESSVIKKLYIKGYECSKYLTSNKNNIPDKLIRMFNNVLHTSLYKSTNGKVKLVIKHVNEGEFSTNDIAKFVDLLKVENINVKMMFVDYLDCMKPTTYGSNLYDNQGQITNDLRSLSRTYHAAIFSATQNRRDAENMQNALSNQMVGDSYNKIKFSDFIYMMRADPSRDPFDDAVRFYTFTQTDYDSNGDIKLEILKYKDQICEDLIPLEIKITKSKDEGKGKTKYLLFCIHNLRMYNTIQEYLFDLPLMYKNSKKLDSDINKMEQMIVSASENFGDIIDINNRNDIETSFNEDVSSKNAFFEM